MSKETFEALKAVLVAHSKGLQVDREMLQVGAMLERGGEIYRTK